MTFNPGGAGFASLSTVSVTLNTNAMASTGGPFFYAPFETYFMTALSSITDNVPPSISIDAPAHLSLLAGQVDISGTAADDVGLSKVEVRLDGGEWVTANGTASWSLSLNTENFLNGTHTLWARATDTSANLSSNASIAVTFFNIPGAYDQSLAAGNASDVTNCDSSVWSSDRAYQFGSFGYIGGGTGFVGNVVSGICAQAQLLYQYERFSPAGFNYVADCPPGLYEITLLEVETFWNAPNQRVFDLYIEGGQVLTNFDIFVSAGGQNLPLSLVFTAVVADAKADIQFVPLIDAPRVSGVRVRKVGDVDSDGDGIPDWWMLGYFDHATGQEGDLSRADDDADDDGFTNLMEFIAGTDPLNINSYFFISLINSGEVAFPSASGRLYQLEENSATDGIWSVISSEQPGNGGLLIVPTTNGSPVKWYRSRVRVAP